MVKKVEPLQYEMQEAILGDAPVFLSIYSAGCNKNKKKCHLLFIASKTPPLHSPSFTLLSFSCIFA